MLCVEEVMTSHDLVSPARRALNPVLSDDPVIESDGASADVFHTPKAQWIAHQMGMIVAAAAGVCLLATFIPLRLALRRLDAIER